jgi:hypothetical protein
VDYEAVRHDLKTAETDLNYSMFYQLTRITKERGALKHDDRLDVLAQGVAYWVESMARDMDRAKEDYKDRMREEEIRNFMDHVMGREFETHNGKWQNVYGR